MLLKKMNSCAISKVPIDRLVDIYVIFWTPPIFVIFGHPLYLSWPDKRVPWTGGMLFVWNSWAKSQEEIFWTWPWNHNQFWLPAFLQFWLWNSWSTPYVKVNKKCMDLSFFISNIWVKAENFQWYLLLLIVSDFSSSGKLITMFLVTQRPIPPL